MGSAADVAGSESTPKPKIDPERWQILIVDDEADVHAVTIMSLKRRSWHGKRFQLHSAYSFEEARDFFSGVPGEEIHVAIVDVVMEEQDAGLKLCNFIRETCPRSLRIILRSGQASLFPPDEVLEEYDIDHYLAKSESTADQVYRLVRGCVRASLDIAAIGAAMEKLEAKNREIRRLSDFKAGVLERLGDPKTGHIGKMIRQVQHILGLDGLPAEAEREIRTLATISEDVNDVYRPLLDARLTSVYASAEAPLRGMPVVVAMQHARARRSVHSIVSGTSASVATPKNAAECVDALPERGKVLLCIDWESIGVLQAVQKKNPEVLAVILATRELFRTHAEAMLNTPSVFCVVATDALQMTRHADAVAIAELLTAASKVSSGDIFGIEKYLAWGAHIRTETVAGSEAGRSAIEAVGEFATECRLKRKSVEAVEVVADELLANAIWDAPVDADGNPRYQYRSRLQPVVLEPWERPIIRYGTDGNLFGVSVTDPFGRLSKGAVVPLLIKGSSSNLIKVNTGAGGAGLGLTMAYSTVLTLVINVLPGQRTEVIGLLNLQQDLGVGESAAFQYFGAIAGESEEC